MFKPARVVFILALLAPTLSAGVATAQSNTSEHRVYLPVTLKSGTLESCPGAIRATEAIAQARSSAWARGIAPRDGDAEHVVRSAHLVTRQQAEYRFELDLDRAYPELAADACIWYVIVSGRWIRSGGLVLAEQPYPGPTTQPGPTATPGPSGTPPPSPTRRATNTPGAGPQPTPTSSFVEGYAGVIVESKGSFAHVARNWAAP